VRLALLAKKEDLRNALKELSRKGIALMIFEDPDEFLDELEREGHFFDLFLVDLDLFESLSDMEYALSDVLNFLSSKDIPIVALVSEKEWSFAFLAEDNLFKDFLVKPISSEELFLRVRRLLRKGSSSFKDERVIRCGDLMIDMERYKVILRGRFIPLTFKEYELLKLLITNRGRVFTREELLNKVWGYDYYGGSRTVDTHISRLRNKLGDYDHKYIQTVRNIGYKFSDEEE